jgi:HTH-type transcriptional regulator / antitoxin HigA
MNTQIKIIKNSEDYENSLKLVESLMDQDPNPESEEGEKLAILVTLIKDYESKKFPSLPLNPIDAILFRMDQLDLKASDLVPYIGSRSRVSEVLSGKRKLTVKMMQALESGLGIPAKSLLSSHVESDNQEDSFNDWSPKLVKEMRLRGCFDDTSNTSLGINKLLSGFFEKVGFSKELAVMFRKTQYRVAPLTSKNALAAWAGCVLKEAKELNLTNEYKSGEVNIDFMRNLAKLSTQENSPILAQKALMEIGIPLIIEPHFKKTSLDGATFFTDGRPVIGMTLRFDRLDNFWFTLMHELAHVSKHENSGVKSFFDELENIKGLEINEQEKEADDLAGEALVQSSKWEVSPARLIPSPLAANALAKELGVHIAIIAGKIRYEGGNYKYLSKIVSKENVRHCFPEIKWS